MRNLLTFFCLIVFTFAVYWQVRGFEFVNYDDEGYVYSNEHIVQGLTWKNVGYAFTTNDLANYHPLTWISYSLDVSMFGLKPGRFHLENVLLHAISAGLLFLFLVRATSEFGLSLIAATVFAIHPVHVESVAWVAERKDVLCGLFFMLGLLAYVSYVRAGSRATRRCAYIAVAVFLVLGLLSKPLIVTFPFVLLLLDYWPLRRSDSWKHLAIEKVPLMFLAIAASVATYISQQSMGAMVGLDSLPITERVANCALSYCRYLGKFFWPTNLSAFYPRVKDLSPMLVMLCILTLVAITVLGWWYRRRAPFLIVGWLFFLGTLVPMIGLVQVGWQSIADRYLYLPMIGLTLMLVWGIAALIGHTRNPKSIQLLFSTSAVVVIGLLSVMTMQQLPYWHDTQKLFEHALAVNPQNSLAHVQLGYFESQLGHTDAAIRHYETAINMEPTYYVPEFDLANLYLRIHQPAQAIKYYQQASSNQPKIAKIHTNWALVLVQLDRPAEAFEHFKAAEQLDPNSADAHYNLAQLFLSAGKWDAAEAEFQATLALVPDHAGAKAGMRTVQAARSVPQR